MGIEILCLIFIFLLLIRVLTRSYAASPSPPAMSAAAALRLPPGPWQLPLIGSLHHLLLSRFSDLPHRALREMSGTYGPLMLLRLGSVPTLVASSAEAAREVMRIHDVAFCSRYLSASLDIISCGGRGVLFSPYNDRWRELRKVCMLELFNPRRVLSFRSVREEEVARLLRSISDQCGGGGRHAAAVVNLSEAICRMVNDVVVRTAIGDRCKHRDEFLRELDEAVRLTGGFSLADLYPSSRLVRWFSASARDMGRCQKNVYGIIGSIIRERDGARVPGRREDDLLGVLLRLQREGGLQFALTDEIVIAVIFVRSISPGLFLKSLTNEFDQQTDRMNCRIFSLPGVRLHRRC
jgi:cytochrome P450